MIDNSCDESDIYTPNPVQMLLDVALEAYPYYDSLIVNWRVLQTFWEVSTLQQFLIAV